MLALLPWLLACEPPPTAPVPEPTPEPPDLHAWIYRDPNPESAGPGPLADFTVGIKDNIDVAGMPTTAGSLALAKNVPKDDAFVVAAVRKSGARIVGKTNLSEWANFRGEYSISGWSGAGGQVRNPYALNRSPCGSSSGSAVAVAVGDVRVAIGTETDGSILCPAAVNGIVGVKPTMGLVSRDGIVPIALSQDTAGAMATTVRDAAALLEVMAAVDPRDLEAQHRPEDIDLHFVDALRDDALTGKRIGVARSLAKFDPKTMRVFEAAIADLKAAGATIVDPVDLTFPGDLGVVELDVMVHQYQPQLEAYFAEMDPAVGIRTVPDLIAFDVAHPEELRFFGHEYLEKTVAHDRTDKCPDRIAELRRRTGEEGIGKALAENQLDAVVAPTVNAAWIIDPILGDTNLIGATWSLAAVSGYPSVTVPMGDIEGLPLGLGFMGMPFGEAKLLALAHAYEVKTSHRKPPTLPLSVP